MTLPLARRMQRMQRSTIREILKITARKEVISFAGGLPAPELFPLQQFGRAMQDAFHTWRAAALQYDVTEGFLPLKEILCDWLAPQGIRSPPENMMLTNGSQQALDLLGKVLLNPNDSVLVENPTYLGAIQAFNAYEPRYRTVPMDDQGMLPDALTTTLKKHKPKFIYTVPTFQNPSGITMSLERRRALIKAARQKNVLIVEDDPYGCLRFSGSPVPSLFELSGGKGVVYLSTFSKILSPGIRLGYVVGEPDIISALVLAKQAADLQPNTLIQRAVYHYAKAGDLEKHIPLITQAYRQRASSMLAAMHLHMSGKLSWVEPEGGMFIWCRLPKGTSATRLFNAAIQNNVAFVTGTVFYANGGGDDTLRLNFTNSTEEQIEEGIQRLARSFPSSSKPRSKR